MAKIKKDTHVVIKKADAYKYLTQFEALELEKLLSKINRGRQIDGKNPHNEYLVVNKDEPYALAVHREILMGEDNKSAKQ